MKISRTILIAAAMAAGLITTVAQAQTFQTNNGVIIGSPGVLPPPRTDGGAIIPTDPNRPIPATNMAPRNMRTNMSPWNVRTNGSGGGWNVRSNGNMFPGTNGVRRVPISSNIPGTSLQPPDSSLPPMTNAPGQANQVIQPGTASPNNPNNGQAQPARPLAPPVRTR